MELTPENAILGWKSAIEANKKHIERIQKLIDARCIKPELSGLSVLEAENEMYRLLIEYANHKFVE